MATCECGRCGLTVKPGRRFVRGHNRRGQSFSVDHRRNLSKASAWRGKCGPESPTWKGDDAGAQAMHIRLRNAYPKTGVCEECDKKAKTQYAFKHHPEPYTDNRDDYRERNAARS